jgi:diguanylate cyclase (GGDEF)-like protein
MPPERLQLIRSLFDEYIEMYAARDDRLVAHFSENFTGYTGSGTFLVNERDAWVNITRQDFAQVSERIGIQMLDLALQDLADDIVLAAATFHIHLPVPEPILAQEKARLVLIFRREGDDWKIVHSSISVAYHPAQEGEVYPLKGLHERNQALAALVDERTRELTEANNKLESLSNTDGLTGIANRRNFDRVLEQEWKRGQRAGLPLSLIILDVDHFKHFNDQYGHLAGDACLQTLAQALAAGRRAGETVARFGGEEFVVLLPNTSAADALEAAQRIQHEIWSLAIAHAETSPAIVTASLGVASVVPSARRLPEDIFRQADKALYRAKQSGRNCLHSAPDEISADDEMPPGQAG